MLFLPRIPIPVSCRNPRLLPNVFNRCCFFRSQRNGSSSSSSSSTADYDDNDEPLSSTSTTLRREVPIVFQDNHLLVINKPPGWHSMPNYENKENREKCLLYHLIRRKLGGGKNQRFLHPLHRIDQPCSGIMILGKTSRAGQRLQPLWSLVRKTYCVVVSPRSNEGWELIQIATAERKFWRRLIGTMVGKNATKTTQGWSVAMVPGMIAGKGRTVQLDWALVGKDDGYSEESDHYVLLIRTTQGARHMVRALLATFGLEIVGDTRYGGTSTTSTTTTTSKRRPPPILHLPFVALHARSLLLPTVFELGSGLDRPRLFTASLPIEWNDVFDLQEDQLIAIENESAQYPYLIK